VHLAPAQDMQVQVKYRLPGIPAGIDHQTVLFKPDFFSRISCGQEQPSQQLRIANLSQLSDMHTGNDQDMNGSLGLHVIESDCQIILVNKRGGDRTAGNLAENA
jgi:hypothetical protein